MAGQEPRLRFCLALPYLDNMGVSERASVDCVRERTPSGHDSVSAPDTFVISPLSGWAGFEVLAGDGAGTQVALRSGAPVRQLGRVRTRFRKLCARANTKRPQLGICARHLCDIPIVWLGRI